MIIWQLFQLWVKLNISLYNFSPFIIALLIPSFNVMYSNYKEFLALIFTTLMLILLGLIKLI